MRPFLLLAILFSFSAPAWADCSREYASLSLQQSGQPGYLEALATAEAKDKFILDAFRIGDTEYWKTDKLARAILEMPEAERESWMSSIGRMYRTVPKKNSSPTARRHIGGRRLLDRLVSLVRDPSQRFAEGNPNQAFHDFLEEQNRIYHTGYGSGEVLTVAKQLQEYAKSLTTASGGPQPELFLGGSFLNGKAMLKGSDLDLTAKNVNILRDVSDLKKKVNESLAARGVEADLDVEPHAVEPEFYGQINPLVLRITADKIEVMVYKPGYTQSSELIRTEKPAEYVLTP